MMRLPLLLLLRLLLPSAVAKPSIVHIVADDLGFNDVWQMQAGGGITDNPHTLTPNIMRLVGEGIALTAYHTYKVCAPSRASIMVRKAPPLHLLFMGQQTCTCDVITQRVTVNGAAAAAAARACGRLGATRGVWGTTT
eukprot:COSAG01_NODE_24598_length_773_cov_1.442136_1_plen_138_part_00